MKTVITSAGDNISADFDKRFGRAAYFCVFNDEDNSTEFILNKNKDADHGAGTKTSELMLELNVKKIISGDFGPKAKDLLDRFDVQMVIMQDDNITINDILNKLKH